MNEPKHYTWEIRDYAAGDEQAITTLFERVFGKTMGATESLEHWRWEYTANPVGPQTIKCVWDGPRLVAHYAISPRRVWVGDETVLAALSLDTMTDPDYGRQGIFVAMAESCYGLMAQRGFQFVYGFPNANSVGGLTRRLKWSFDMPTPVHVKPLDMGRIAAVRLGRQELTPWLSLASRASSLVPGVVERFAPWGRGGRSLSVERFAEFEAWVDDLWARCRTQHQLWVARDLPYLRWRYDLRPESDYVRLRVMRGTLPVGYVVLGFDERGGDLACFILDLVADLSVPGSVSALLLDAERIARDRHCATLSALCTPGCRYRNVLLRQLFLPLPERWFPKELHFGGRVMDGKFAPLTRRPEAWYLAWGDIDVL